MNMIRADGWRVEADNRMALIDEADGELAFVDLSAGEVKAFLKLADRHAVKIARMPEIYKDVNDCLLGKRRENA